MATEYSILRSHLLNYIRSGISDQHAQVSIDSLRGFFESKALTLDADGNDWRTIQQIIHEFYIEGIIIPGPIIQPRTRMQSAFLRFPSYHVTEYGERILQETEYQPHDPDSYLQKIRS